MHLFKEFAKNWDYRFQKPQQYSVLSRVSGTHFQKPLLPSYCNSWMTAHYNGPTECALGLVFLGNRVPNLLAVHAKFKDYCLTLSTPPHIPPPKMSLFGDTQNRFQKQEKDLNSPGKSAFWTFLRRLANILPLLRHISFKRSAFESHGSMY